MVAIDVKIHMHHLMLYFRHPTDATELWHPGDIINPLKESCTFK